MIKIKQFPQLKVLSPWYQCRCNSNSQGLELGKFQGLELELSKIFRLQQYCLVFAFKKNNLKKVRKGRGKGFLSQFGKGDQAIL
jgi:hypothetical protein